jgi:hypothetical protein
VNAMDTCNVLVQHALTVLSASGGINDQLAGMSTGITLPPVASILKLSAAFDTYEKTAPVRYPVVTIYCQRLRNMQTEKFRMLSGIATLVVEIRASGERAEELEFSLNSYVQAACQVLEACRGVWTSIGTYAGAYDIKFQALRPGGKQFTKSAQIEFEIQISR